MEATWRGQRSGLLLPSTSRLHPWSFGLWRCAVEVSCFFRCGHVLRLPDSVDHGKSDGLGKKIKLFNDQHAATFRLTGGGKRSQPNTAPSPSKPRTLCQPEFSPDDEPADPLRVWEPTTQLLKGEFEQKHEPLESNAPFISLLHFDG